MEKDLDQTFIYSEPLACSETPVAAREDAFKDLLLDISQKMSKDNVTALAYIADPAAPAGSSFSALELLQLLERQGTFSDRSCGKLEEHLRRIGRYDLAQSVQDYTERYPEISRTGGKQR